MDPFSTEGIAAFRQTFRREQIPRAYRGELHALFLTAVPGAAIAYVVSRLAHPRWTDFLVLLPLLLLGSLVVWTVHKFPLHRPMGPLRAIYKIHSLQHHRFFTDQVTEYESPRDFAIVFFPWFTPVTVVLLQMPAFYFGAKALGASENLALIASLINPIYYLLYELFHFSSHVPASSLLLRVPFLRAMREHHRIHHDPLLMARYNFNVVLPICDWVFGTHVGSREEAARRAESEAHAVEK